MSRNGSGTYSLPAGNPVVTGTTISSTTMNSTLTDIANALTTSIASDGQTTVTANIPMAGYKLTGLGAATTNGDAVRYEQAVLAGANSSITSMTGLSAPTVAANPVRATDLQAQLATAFTTGGTSTAFTLTPTPAIAANAANQRFNVTIHTNPGASPTLAISGQTALNFKYRDSTGTKQFITSAVAPSGWRSDVVNDGTDWVMEVVLPSASATSSIPVRQTVLGGPVDSSGLPNFGGSTGSTTVTASGTLYATAANGFGTTGGVDRVGNIVNPSWTGLSTNGTMYIYLDIASDGTCTTGSTTLAPTYQFGGAYSVTSGQNTFNIQEMTMKAGNGSVATQVYRVFAGEVTVSGGVVTVITWYALMRRFISAAGSLPAAGTRFSANHNIGFSYGVKPSLQLVCVTAEANYSVGDVVEILGNYLGALSYNSALSVSIDKLTIGSNNTSQISIPNKTTGAIVYLTNANWNYRFMAQGGW